MGVSQRAWIRVLRTEAWTEQDGKCLYCREKLTLRCVTADHKWPRARNGGNQKNNIAAACYPCNRAKGSLSHIEFFRLIDQKMPKGLPPEIMMVWAGRRIWKRANRAIERIERRAH